MKVGVDAVLLGAWANLDNTKRILEVGTGCGVISLMLAQRSSVANIDAIDIDEDSIAEATENILNSHWKKRLDCKLSDFMALECGEKRYDLIISNPPYFDSGVDANMSIRMQARHEGSLSPYSLLKKGETLLSHNGRVVMIIPFNREQEIEEYAFKLGYSLISGLRIIGKEGKGPVRVLLDFQIEDRNKEICKDNNLKHIKSMVIENLDGQYSDEYKKLTQDFYLNF